MPRLPAWRPRSEVELCAPLVAHYEAAGWTVYQEVCLAGGSRADLVLERGDELRIVEAKRGFTEALLRQADWWRRAYGEPVWVAVPVRVAPFRLGRLGGLGLVRVLGPRASDVYEIVRPAPPVRLPAYARRLRRALGPHLAGRGVAGAPRSDFYSPFSELAERVAGLARERPGVTPREASRAVGHAFESHAWCARRLLQWARSGRLRGRVYALRMANGRYGLFPDRRDWRTRPAVPPRS